MGAPGAIRKRVGDGITDALDLITPADVAADPSLTDDFNLDLDRLGNTEARYRAAIIAGLIPRCKVDLKGIRRTEGGGRDVGVGRERWIDTSGSQWSATCSQQPVIVTVKVWDRTLNHADRDAVLIASALNGGYVTWPGEFDAWVLDAMNVMAIEHRIDGTYRMEMRVAGLDRAEWDDEQGLARAGLAVEIDAIDPLEAATEGATATSVENTGAIQPRIPEVNIGETLDIDLVEYFGHFALPVGAVVDSDVAPRERGHGRGYRHPDDRHGCSGRPSNDHGNRPGRHPAVAQPSNAPRYRHRVIWDTNETTPLSCQHGMDAWTSCKACADLSLSGQRSGQRISRMTVEAWGIIHSWCRPTDQRKAGKIRTLATATETRWSRFCASMSLRTAPTRCTGSRCSTTMTTETTR